MQYLINANDITTPHKILSGIYTRYSVRTIYIDIKFSYRKEYNRTWNGNANDKLDLYELRSYYVIGLLTDFRNEQNSRHLKESGLVKIQD